MVKAKWFSWLLDKQTDRTFLCPPFVRSLKFDLKSTLIMIDLFLQLLPQILPEEFVSVLDVLQSHMSTVCDDTWMYRLISTSQFPLHCATGNITV